MRKSRIIIIGIALFLVAYTAHWAIQDRWPARVKFQVQHGQYIGTTRPAQPTH